MSTDLRGFDYALEPVQRQRQWQLDALQARLGLLTQEIVEARLHIEHLQLRRGEQADEISRLVLQGPDPGAHRQGLRWLTRLGEEIQIAQNLLVELRERRKLLQTEVTQQQTKVEVLERHRQECVQEFAQSAQSRMASAADRDWLARRTASAGDADSQDQLSLESAP